MSGFQRKAFWGVVLAQVLVLAFMIGKRMHLLDSGQTVLLRCVPIDPRSLFSGDYVILRFQVSQLSGLHSKAPWNVFHEEFRYRDKVYVALQKPKKGKYWRAVAVSHHRKKLQKKHPVVLRGTVQASFRQSLRIRYGVEQYFVPQFAGKRIEKNIRNASVEVAVSPSGESAIKRLFLSGKEVTFY